MTHEQAEKITATIQGLIDSSIIRSMVRISGTPEQMEKAILLEQNWAQSLTRLLENI